MITKRTIAASLILHAAAMALLWPLWSEGKLSARESAASAEALPQSRIEMQTSPLADVEEAAESAANDQVVEPEEAEAIAYAGTAATGQASDASEPTADDAAAEPAEVATDQAQSHGSEADREELEKDEAGVAASSDTASVRTLEKAEEDHDRALADVSVEEGQLWPEFRVRELDTEMIDRLITTGYAVAFYQAEEQYLIYGPLSDPQGVIQRPSLQGFSARAIALEGAQKATVRAAVVADLAHENLDNGVARLLLSHELDRMIRRRQAQAAAQLHLDVEALRATSGRFHWGEDGAVEYQIAVVVDDDGEHRSISH